MRTVKQVSELTGISVRMLHYYDEIGLLKPSETTEAGYRLYDDKALETLQQILFFKELELPLKEVKEIMNRPGFDKTTALENQKKLLILKRNRLNDLIELIKKTLEGEISMNFKEFDMSEYFNALEEFKKEHEDKIRKAFGGLEKYNEFIEKCKSKEEDIAKMAIKKYGSIERFVEAMRKNYHSEALDMAEQYDAFKKDCLEDQHPKLSKLFEKLISDLSKDPSSREIQQIAEEIADTVKTDYEIFNAEGGNDRWYSMVQCYLLYPDWIKAVDAKYGTGASKFIGEALKTSLGDKQPRVITLFERLTSDLNKDPYSEEVQNIVKEMAEVTEKQHEALKIDEGENHWGYTADLYLTNPSFIKVTDQKYGSGASEFIGEALKYYSENGRK